MILRLVTMTLNRMCLSNVLNFTTLFLFPCMESACSPFYTYHRDLASLRSSIYNYHYENGRRYHAYHAGSYW